MSVYQLKLISIYSPLLPLVLFLVFCLKHSKIELKVIFIYILLSIGIDIYTTTTTYGKENVYGIQAVFSIAEYLFLSGFLYLSLSNTYFRKIILAASILFVIYSIYQLPKIDKSSFDSVGSSVEGILIITYCIMYFFEQISKPATNFIIYASPNFWVVLAFLVYMSSTLFLFIVTSALSKDEQHQYWFINHISSIIFNIFLSIAFILSRKKSVINKKPNDDYFIT